MAFEQPIFLVGVLPSNSDQSGDATTLSQQFLAQKVVPLSGSTGQAGWDLASASDPVQGVLQNNPQQFEAAIVMVSGISKAVYGASVTVGQLLMANGSGQLVPATSGNYIVGQALEAGGLGDVGSVILKSPVKA